MAEFEKRLACVINADGTIARGYRIGGCDLQGENRLVISWKETLQCEAKTNFAGHHRQQPGRVSRARA